jgi:hypothetical protein
LASKESADAVRQVLLGQNTAFPDAEEVCGSSDTEDISSKSEEEHGTEKVAKEEEDETEIV